MGESVLVNCRNFACGNNRSGQCISERITLTAQGGIIDQLRCIEAFARSIESTEENSQGGSECKNTKET